MKRPTHALVVCNGEMPSRALIAPLLKRRPYILCADGGANRIRSFGITPHAIIGDLDSITDRTRHHFSDVPVIHEPDQNSTDLEKALDHLLGLRVRSAVVIGATGERADHTVSNLSILAKYHTRLALQFLDERCTIEAVRKRVRFRAPLGQQISLVPMGLCEGVTTAGLKYPLRSERLAFGVREGTSNEAVATTVTVSVRSGHLLLFRIHPAAR